MDALQLLTITVVLLWMALLIITLNFGRRISDLEDILWENFGEDNDEN